MKRIVFIFALICNLCIEASIHRYIFNNVDLPTYNSSLEYSGWKFDGITFAAASTYHYAPVIKNKTGCIYSPIFSAPIKSVTISGCRSSENTNRELCLAPLGTSYDMIEGYMTTIAAQRIPAGFTARDVFATALFPGKLNYSISLFSGSGSGNIYITQIEFDIDDGNDEVIIETPQERVEPITKDEYCYAFSEGPFFDDFNKNKLKASETDAKEWLDELWWRIGKNQKGAEVAWTNAVSYGAWQAFIDGNAVDKIKYGLGTYPVSKGLYDYTGYWYGYDDGSLAVCAASPSDKSNSVACVGFAYFNDTVTRLSKFRVGYIGKQFSVDAKAEEQHIYFDFAITNEVGTIASEFEWHTIPALTFVAPLVDSLPTITGGDSCVPPAMTNITAYLPVNTVVRPGERLYVRWRRAYEPNRLALSIDDISLSFTPLDSTLITIR